MAKKKDGKVIAVKNPQLGKMYRFIFGGHSEQIGMLAEHNDKLTDHYGYKWYTFTVPLQKHEINKFNLSRDHWRYPASIFDIIEEIK